MKKILIPIIMLIPLFIFSQKWESEIRNTDFEDSVLVKTLKSNSYKIDCFYYSEDTTYILSGDIPDMDDLIVNITIDNKQYIISKLVSYRGEIYFDDVVNFIDGKNIEIILLDKKINFNLK